MKFEIDERMTGVASAAGAYLLWGVLPVYWKLVDTIPAHEVLAHRFIWSFFFMIIMILVTRRVRGFADEVRQILSERRKLSGVAAASLLISLNWFTYIWAVMANRVVETSLGYYINPLVSVMLGIAVLKEKLSLWQTVAFFLAAGGVLNMVIHFGTVPWVALVLALTFGVYGLVKKMINIGAITAITLETMLVTPFAFAYIAYMYQQGAGAFGLRSPVLTGLLLGTGMVTAVPLLLFSVGANRLPLSMLGFLQYFAPTIMLVLGIFVYNEPFTKIHLISFSLIWLALTIFSLSKTSLFNRLETMLLRKSAAEKNQLCQEAQQD